MDILLIEDDERVSELIKRGLENQQYNMTVAYDGEMGEKLAMENDYNLIITDIILPKIDGLELCREIRKAKPQIPIIMLTALGRTDDKIEGFDAGADDYLVKPFDFRELEVRIRALLNRNKRATNSLKLQVGNLEMDLQTKTVYRQGVNINLTPKEFKLLEYMMRNNGRLLTRTEIAEKVWETHFDTGTNFIDVYINYLRKKIEKDFTGKLIHTKPGMGFIFKVD
ncbi:MAG TPA: response regulator transcription factor [Flavipsychrobacter sp.]|nr:response regulator transcription factor [Flavipsychrobacter sp.]